MSSCTKRQCDRANPDREPRLGENPVRIIQDDRHLAIHRLGRRVLDVGRAAPVLHHLELPVGETRHT
jgi:hypothetical protein